VPDGTYRTSAQKYGQTDRVRQKFTGYQKDDETGLDFAEARMYQNLYGRFSAVDPLLASGKSEGGGAQTLRICEIRKQWAVAKTLRMLFSSR
jgi:RHS repeat-associated protein